MQEKACTHVQSAWHLIGAVPMHGRVYEQQHGLSRALELAAVSERSHVFFTGRAPRQSIETERSLLAPKEGITFIEQASAAQQHAQGDRGMQAH